ncbi:hemerythrin [Parelusimicrobium proximum]|uniref:bacteriohemerythrin n=1 Tax=Parelusimicrobium proximum TaxID=3228953 RepID=UPI003D17F6FF
MIYNWEESLETGDERIDTQHKQLIETLNKLIIAHQENRGPAVLASTLAFMTKYVVQHFHDEEELQIRYNYPAYEDHKKKHEDFKIVVRDLTARMALEGYTEALMNNTIRTIADWLITHIKEEDLRLAIHIQKIESGE